MGEDTIFGQKKEKIKEEEAEGRRTKSNEDR